RLVEVLNRVCIGRVLRAGLLAQERTVLPERLLVERSDTLRFGRRLVSVEAGKVGLRGAAVGDAERVLLADESLLLLLESGLQRGNEFLAECVCCRRTVLIDELIQRVGVIRTGLVRCASRSGKARNRSAH